MKKLKSLKNKITSFSLRGGLYKLVFGLFLKKVRAFYEDVCAYESMYYCDPKKTNLIKSICLFFFAVLTNGNTEKRLKTLQYLCGGGNKKNNRKQRRHTNAKQR